jgi:hypothetical protein
MMVDLGKTEILKREMTQASGSLWDCHIAPLYSFEKFRQAFAVHSAPNRAGA